jgi:hypothetical protein
MTIVILIFISVIIVVLLQAKNEYKNADKNINSLILEAANATSTGDYNRAIQLLTSALNQNSMYHNVWNSRGENYMKLKMYEQALADFNKSININPNRSINFTAYENKKNIEELIIQSKTPPSSKLSLENLIIFNEGVYTIQNMRNLVCIIGNNTITDSSPQFIKIDFKVARVFFESPKLRELLKTTSANITKIEKEKIGLKIFLSSIDNHKPDENFEELYFADFILLIKKDALYIINTHIENISEYSIKFIGTQGWQITYTDETQNIPSVEKAHNFGKDKKLTLSDINVDERCIYNVSNFYLSEHDSDIVTKESEAPQHFEIDLINNKINIKSKFLQYFLLGSNFFIVKIEDYKHEDRIVHGLILSPIAPKSTDSSSISIDMGIFKTAELIILEDFLIFENVQHKSTKFNYSSSWKINKN